MTFYYCDACGLLLRAKKHPGNCININCKSSYDMYALDEFMVELIMFLHKHGIPTRDSCSGHCVDPSGPYIVFDITPDSIDHELAVVNINKVFNKVFQSFDLNLKFEIVSTISRIYGQSYGVRLTQVKNVSPDNRLDTDSALHGIGNIRSALKEKLVLDELSKLTTPGTKLRFGLYNQAKYK